MDSGGGVLLNFFITGQKHDRDRFELKFGLIPEKIVARQKWTYDVNILMLSPKNLGFLNSGLENGIEENFQSFLGLHVHAESLGKDRQKILQKYLKHLKDKPSESILSYTVLELESYLKALIRELKSSKKDEILDSWITRLNDLELTLEEFRATLVGISKNGLSREVALASEYLSHSVVQFLGELDDFLERSKIYIDGLEKVLEKMSQQELSFRNSHSFYVFSNKSKKEKKEEKYLRRTSLLKKYFQRALFIKVKSSPIRSRMLVPVYGFSAALAASWAVMIQIYSIGNFEQRIGFNTIALVAVAIFGYVVKDILKDYLRRFFFKSSQRFFPDFKKTLFLNREKIGRIDEFIEFLEPEDLNEDFVYSRNQVASEDLEQFVKEEIILYKKRVNIDLRNWRHGREYRWGLREVLRVKLAQVMTSMDEPERDIFYMLDNADFEKKSVRKSYYIYMAVWIEDVSRNIDKGRADEGRKFKIFRLKINKDGLISVKSYNRSKFKKIPPIPKRGN